MAEGVRFTFSGDGSNYISTLSTMEDATLNAGKTIEEVFGRKLKQVISVVAIEQAVQRTAQWNQEIQQTAKKLGVTATQLQTLNHIASQTGTAEGDIQGLFENIQKAGMSALEGNDELITSFKKLGITIKDIQNSTSSELFSKVMAKTGEMGDVRKLDPRTRGYVDSITGTPENTFQSIQQDYQNTPGEGLGGKSSALEGNGQILSESDSKEMQIAWSDFVTNLKEAEIALMPLATILLSIVQVFLDAIGALANIGSGFNDLIHGKFSDAFQKIGSTLLNGIWGVTGMLFSMFGGLTGLVGGIVKMFNKKAGKSIEEFGKNFTDGWDQLKKDENESLGINKNIAKKGQALGEATTIVLTGGDTAVVKGAGMAARGASKLTKGLGMKGTTAQLEEIAANAKGYSGVGNTKVPGSLPNLGKPLPGSALGETWEQRMAQKNAIYTAGQFQEKFKAAQKINPKLTKEDFIKTPEGEALSNKAMEYAGSGGKEFTKGIHNHLLEAKSGFGIMGMLTSGLAGAENYKKLANQPYTQAYPLKPAFSPMAFQQLSGGSANLKMGGLFGVGSTGEKIVDLNQKMLYKLALIAEHTNPEKPHMRPQHMYNGYSHRAGGI